MKHIRILSLSLALVLMLGLFAGCGKSGSGSESGSGSQPDASVSQSGEDVSNPDVSTPDNSAPDATLPNEDAPEVKPEEKPQTPAPEVKPEQKPEKPAPEVKPEEKPQEPTPEVKPEEKPQEPTPEVKPEEKPEEPAPAKVDLAAFFQTIFTDPANAPALIPMEADALDAFYAGLTAIQTSQRVAYMPMMTAVPCEIVMVECANAADVEAVKTIFQSRIDTQVNDHFNYPMVIEAWEKEAKVVSNGNFVALFVVSGMTDEVVSSFNALF